jgi:phosphoribosylformimino-5-aminoimidazole carboxamide ribotide isomerase
VLIIPAIDLRNGQCVRLKQGDYAQETIFGSDPVAVARRWVDEGARYLHIVDLDGAKSGRLEHSAVVRRIVEAVGVPCQLGGGLRQVDDLAEVLAWGVERVVVGSRAVQDPGWLADACNQFPGKLVLGIDAKEGTVATDGWLKLSGRSAADFAEECAGMALAAIVYTDIGRDGMLKGPNFDAIAKLARLVPIPVIASGGITTLDDIRRLAELKIPACIVGRALYEGRIQLREAMGVIHG